MLIKKLETTEELIKSFPIIKQLRTNLILEEYLELVLKMKEKGYNLIALYDEENIIGLAGFSIMWNLYYKKHIWIYDLVIDKKFRNQGYGKILLNYIENLAIQEKCDCIALSSSFQRVEAHQFYCNNLYEKYSFVFKKMLK